MIKVLVVDDEPLVRQLIKCCIDWESYGLEIAGEASGALEGIELVKERKPDVVFTDIMMPVKSGLEFTRMIKEEAPSVRVVLVSGYDEFEYANKGIKLGVFDYILKPIDKEELIRIAKEVKADIQKERMREEEFARIKEELWANAHDIIEKALYTLLVEDDCKNALECLGYYGISLDQTVCQIAVIDIERQEEKIGKIESLVRFTHCRKMIEKYVSEYEGIYVFSADIGRIIILNNNDGMEFEQFCEAMRISLEKCLDEKLYIGIGKHYNEVTKMRQSYREASETLQYKYVVGGGHTVCYGDICFLDQSTPEMDGDILRRLSFFVRSGMDEDVNRMLGELFEQMKQAGITKDDAVVYAIKIIMEILPVFHCVAENGRTMDQDISSVITKIIGLETLTDLWRFMANILINISKAVKEEVSEKAVDVVGKVLEYIENHYMEEDITLAQVAKNNYINSSYLSRVFKEKAGKPFSDYLFEIRMENAKRLLQQTNMKAYEIAEKVGIKDPPYFSVCFKKYTGKSVSQYRAECI